MKKLVLSGLLLMVVLIAGAQDKKEYLILRATHYLKPHGMETRLEVELGNEYNHSLKSIVENGPQYSVRINNPDGTVSAIKTEADFLNHMADFGYVLDTSYPIKISGKDYIQYILVKTMR